MELNFIIIFFTFIGDMELSLHELTEDIIQMDNKEKHASTSTIAHKVHANNLFSNNDQSIFIYTFN